jgi:hypothetical protein
MGETTEIIRRRIHHWKTTLAGIASILCPIIALFVPPEYSVKVLAAASMLSGAGLIAAADAGKQKP